MNTKKQITVVVGFLSLAYGIFFIVNDLYFSPNNALGIINCFSSEINFGLRFSYHLFNFTLIVAGILLLENKQEAWRMYHFTFLGGTALFIAHSVSANYWTYYAYGIQPILYLLGLVAIQLPIFQRFIGIGSKEKNKDLFLTSLLCLGIIALYLFSVVPSI